MDLLLSVCLIYSFPTHDPRLDLRRLTDMLDRAMLGFVVYGGGIASIPADDAVDPDGKVDWIGAYLGVAGLILFNFVWKCGHSLSWHLSSSRSRER